MNPTLKRYERLGYPGQPYLYTHPARLSGLSALAGGPTPLVENARILELGCGDGINLLSLAAQLPGAIAIGIDGSEEAISKARRHAQHLRLDTVEFIEADLATYTTDMTFDYIIAHGVYSWVEEPIRRKILNLISTALAPEGLAYVSYNITPGWHLRNIVRDAMLFGTPQDAAPTYQIKRATEITRDLAGAIPQTLLHGRVFKTFAEHLGDTSAPLLFHDFLAPENHPISHAQFSTECQRYGLSWLMESAASDIRHPELPEALLTWIGTHRSESTQQALLDHAYGRDFRRSILVHSSVKAARPSSLSSVLRQMHVALRAPAPEPIDIRQGVGLTLPTPRGQRTFTETHEKGLIAALGASFPASRPVSTLALLVNELCGPFSEEYFTVDALTELLITLAEREMLDILTEARKAPSPNYGRPRTYRVAAYELRRHTHRVTTRFHEQVSLDPLDHYLLQQCDGSPIEQLIEAAVDKLLTGEIPLLPQSIRAQVDPTLEERLGSLVTDRVERLGEVGLLEDNDVRHDNTNPTPL